MTCQLLLRRSFLLLNGKWDFWSWYFDWGLGVSHGVDD